jgi:DNA mismatch repair protein MutL
VADVFYNLPARRKFLKSDAAEAAQVSRVLTQLALCYPELGVTLTSSGRKVLQCPPVATLRDRLYQLYGDRADLIDVRRETGDVKIVGFIAALAEQGPTRGPQNIFINRRVVKDRTIAHAIIDAYSVASIKERSPEVHLFIEMPHDAVDVNVHPTKAEVRFRDQSYMHELIRRTIGDALGRGPAPELQLEAPAGFRPVASTLPLPHAYPSTFPSRWTAGPVGPAQVGGPANAGPCETPRPDETAGSCADAYVGAAFSRPDSNGPAIAASPIRPMTALGQFRDTFIIAIDDEGIAIIDQHVAHERVLFERITERLSSGTLESQRMLVPMLVEMPASGRQALSAHAADLERLGFEIEAFGGESLRVTACPALLSREDCAAALRALAEDLEGLDRGAGVDAAIKRIAATTACHAAVKANYPLTHEKMAHILDELRRTAYSTICPHGRPVMLRITRREVEKNFQRV